MTIRIPTNVDDAYLASLPFDVTQTVFVGGTVRGSRRTTTAGWFGSNFDPTTGAVAIVRADSALSDLVGERIRATYRAGGQTRTVAVYVQDERAFPDDLTEDLLLSRRAFFALANLALDDITVIVDVLA
jgi:hypothetical protein